MREDDDDGSIHDNFFDQSKFEYSRIEVVTNICEFWKRKENVFIVSIFRVFKNNEKFHTSSLMMQDDAWEAFREVTVGSHMAKLSQIDKKNFTYASSLAWKNNKPQTSHQLQ
jgi:hypothetical protein